MGRHPDLGRWRAAFPPLVLLAPLALAPAFVARGYFVRVLTAGIATGNADGAPPFVAWNELYRNGLKSALLSAVLLAPLVLGGRARSARDRRSRERARRSRVRRRAGPSGPRRRGVAAVGAVAGGSSGRSPRRISSRSRTSGRRRSRRSPRPDASATAFTRAASAVSLAPARTPPRGWWRPQRWALATRWLARSSRS